MGTHTANGTIINLPKIGAAVCIRSELQGDRHHHEAENDTARKQRTHACTQQLRHTRRSLH